MWDIRQQRSENALLLGLDYPYAEVSINESLDELAMLANTAGATVIDRFIQKRSVPENSTYIGKGKLEQVRLSVLANNIKTVIVDDEISPTQESNLEAELGCKVIDRTRLILDIFAIHASSSVGKLQVELAQMQYYLPRLKNIWTEFSKLGGGIGTRGPGEKKIEVDRRIISDRIASIRKKLSSVMKQRRTLRKKRNESYMKNICLIGYTNAGKSSLMKKLTNADVLVADKLFATLSPTTRKFKCGNYDLLLTDTVGFIRKLPHQLVEAFMATLEQVKEADLLLHVIDISSETHRQQVKAVENVLSELKAGDVPVIKVFNKIDSFQFTPEKKSSSGPVYVSALKGTGIEELMEVLEDYLDNTSDIVKLRIPQSESRLISAVYENAKVESRNYDEDHVVLTGYMGKDLKTLLERYIVK